MSKVYRPHGKQTVNNILLRQGALHRSLRRPPSLGSKQSVIGIGRFKKGLIPDRSNIDMRVAMATVVALLIISFVDEHFDDARYTQAATAVLSQIVRSFG
jgi:hypothetical protein